MVTTNEVDGRVRLERRTWEVIRALVQANEHPPGLRERLGLGLGVGRLRALLLLRDGPLSLRAIAAARQVDAPYATHIVDRLETLGYVGREPDPDDRRRKLVRLTEAGHGAATVAAEALAAPPAAFAVLTVDELHLLDELLRRLLAASGETAS